MPVTLKRTIMNYRDGNGRYVSVDVAAEETTAQMIANVTAAGSAQIALLNTRETQIAASYPSVTEMEGMVAVPFVEATAYPAGQYVIQAVNNVNGLYFLPDGHEANVTWENTTKIGPLKVGNEINDLKSAISEEDPHPNLWTSGDKTGTKRVSKKINFANGVTYTISAEITSNDTDSTQSLVYITDNSAHARYSGYMLHDGNRHSVTFTCNADDWTTLYFYASNTLAKSEDDTIEVRNVKVEVGGTASPYMPYGRTAIDYIARGDISNIEESYFTNRGNLVDLGYTALSDCKKSGWYGFSNSQVSSVTDLPDDFGDTAGAVLVLNGAFNNTRLQIIFNGSATLRNDKFWYRILFSNEYTGWIRASRNMYTMEYQGFVSVLGITSIMQINTPGWYGFPGSYSSSITDLPTNWTGSAGTIEIVRPAYGGLNYKLIRLTDAYGNIWMCLMNGTTVYTDWALICGPLKDSEIGFYALQGKNVAIIGDSISTNGSYSASNPLGNVPEIIISQEDVDANIQLKAYVTYYDIGTVLNGSVTIDGVTTTGHTIVSDDVGKEISFIPVAADVTTPPKMIGVPSNYNPASRVVWWEVLKNKFGFNPIPVCWSGSSISSHEGNDTKYKTSYAWHDAQIRKCGIRTPGTTGFDAETGKINRTPPDAIFIYRGTNDMTHSPYARLTAGYFDNYNWQYPENDTVDTNKYGYKEALCLTIKKLRDTYPNAKIFICTLNVFKRVNYSHYPTNNGLYSLPQMNDAIREVADFMGCDVISFDRDGITFENCYSEGYITDSATAPTHPSDKGHKAMALKAMADIKAKYSSMT